jgi:purine operon repressor
MDKVKRNERIGAMIKILTNSPNKSFTLTHFSDLFGSAKSTISEDVDIAREILEKYKLGTLRTVTGASGGVLYLPQPTMEESLAFIRRLCRQLEDPNRILTGGFLYMLDLLSDPLVVSRMGEIISQWYVHQQPDFILTVETKGIPVALMTAKFLSLPLIIARRDAKITDGSVVTINYVTGSSSRRIQTMSLPKRYVKEGQKALIVDDFMKGGGTTKGLTDLMQEFSVEVVGAAMVMATAEPPAKMVGEYKSLMTLRGVDETARIVDVQPSEWLLAE